MSRKVDYFAVIAMDKPSDNSIPMLSVSNSVVMYLRMLTSAEIKSEASQYSPFLFNPETTEPMEPENFCNNFVEAIGKEAGTIFSRTYHCGAG